MLYLIDNSGGVEEDRVVALLGNLSLHVYWSLVVGMFLLNDGHREHQGRHENEGKYNKRTLGKLFAK